MTDTRKLLERCARVMGLTPAVNCSSSLGILLAHGHDTVRVWNPLQSVADAAELAIKCKVDVDWNRRAGSVVASWYDEYGDEPNSISFKCRSKDHPTEQAAYCYAVVNVVAQMGGE